MFEKLLCAPTIETNVAVVELVKTMMGEVAPATIAAAQQAMAARRDFSELLASIRVPTLVIAGEFDAIAPPVETEAWANHIADSKFAVIAGTGHLPPLESPQDYNQVLLEFLIQ